MCRRISGCRKRNAQFVLFIPCVVNHRINSTWKALLAIRASQAKTYSDHTFGLVAVTLPILIREILFAAMQLVLAMIDGQVKLLVIDRKTGIANSVAKSSYGAAKVRMTADVTIKFVKAIIDVCFVAIAVRDVDFKQCRAKIHN